MKNRHRPHKKPITLAFIVSCCVIDTNGCWVWQRSKKKAGYGQIRDTGGCKVVHRVTYSIAIGPIPDGLCVCHHCDNPPCCNPEHLFVGTVDANMKDKMLKGRAGIKLNKDQVLQILKDSGTQKDIAKRFGVSPAHISFIKTRRTWKWLESTN